MSEEEKIRVLLADDHRVLLGSLRALLERNGLSVVGEATTGEQAVELAARLRPHVVLMDLEMPGGGGMAAAYRLRKTAPSTKVLILSAHEEDEEVLEALSEASVAGYLVKSDAPEELISAVRAVHGGRRYVSPSVAPIVIGRLRRPNQKAGPADPRLSRREREVLRMVGQGATSKDIAQQLGISPKTAQVHRENIKEKLGLRTTADMVRYAIKRKIVKLD